MQVLLQVLEDTFVTVPYGVKQKGETFLASREHAERYCRLGWTKDVNGELSKKVASGTQALRPTVTID